MAQWPPLNTPLIMSSTNSAAAAMIDEDVVFTLGLYLEAKKSSRWRKEKARFFSV